MSEQNSTPRPEGEEPTNADGPDTGEEAAHDEAADTQETADPKLDMSSRLGRFGINSGPRGPRTSRLGPDPLHRGKGEAARYLRRRLLKNLSGESLEREAKRKRDELKKRYPEPRKEGEEGGNE